jgi:hypothetical protein
MDTRDFTKEALNRRLESVGWALFLIMAGGLWLIPGDRLPGGLWLIGVGVIMLGLNGVRLANGIKMSSLTLVLGVLGLVLGMGSMAGANLPLFPILLILIGLNALIKMVEGGRRID